MRVAIVGAGITGLALAGGLHRLGLDVTVFEQSPTVRGGGAGITLAPNALTALNVLGGGAPLRERQRRQAPLLGGQREPDGAWLARFPVELTSRSLVIARDELHSLLLERLPGDFVRTGTRVRDADPLSGTLTFSEGAGPMRAETFDLVVGADGLNSAIRRCWPNEPGTRYAGYATWRGLTQDPVDLGGVGAETWGVDARFGIAPLHDGRVYWFGVHTAPEPRRGQKRMDELHRLFAHWHHPIPELIRATREESVQYLPIRELAGDLGSFVMGRVVLAGDAAHAMTPNLGQGACQGLEDAATLASLLHTSTKKPHATGSLEAVLAEYDRDRRPRTQAIARTSRRVGRAAHTGGHLIADMRNRILRAVPDRVLASQATAVTKWAPPVLE